MALSALEKAVLDIYYRLKSGQIAASEISGTIGEGNLPVSVTGDIGTARLVDGSVTMAKLGSDVTMIKTIQRGLFDGTGAAAGWHTNSDLALAMTVNPDKAVLVLGGATQSFSSVHNPICCRISSDGTAIEYLSAGVHDTVIAWQVVEYV